MKKLICTLIISISLISCNVYSSTDNKDCFVLDPVALKEGETQWVRLPAGTYKHIVTHYCDYIQYTIEGVTYQTTMFTLVKY